MLYFDTYGLLTPSTISPQREVKQRIKSNLRKEQKSLALDNNVTNVVVI